MLLASPHHISDALQWYLILSSSLSALDAIGGALCVISTVWFASNWTTDTMTTHYSCMPWLLMPWMEIHATCLIFDIIRRSLALPLVWTRNDGWVPFLDCQLTWVHATFLWSSQVSAIASSLCGSVWLYMAADNRIFTIYAKSGGLRNMARMGKPCSSNLGKS